MAPKDTPGSAASATEPLPTAQLPYTISADEAKSGLKAAQDVGQDHASLAHYPGLANKLGEAVRTRSTRISLNQAEHDLLKEWGVSVRKS